MAFTEFYVQTTGSNLNAGSTTADAAVYTGVGDSDGTSVFTPSDGSTPANTVSVGDFGSVYVTVGATIAVFVGRITAVAAGVNGAVTFSTTAKSGTFPAASGGAHTITLKTGGAWQGPNGAVAFPFGFAVATMTNAAGDTLRVNFKAGTNYAITSAMTHSLSGPVTFQGYTASAGDGGKVTIDGTIGGASYVMLTMGGGLGVIRDLIFQNNGASGSADGVQVTGSNILTIGCVFSSIRGSGYKVGGNRCQAVECEAYACNQSNTANLGGFAASTECVFVRCIAHDNTGSNAEGFYQAGGETTVFVDCISDSNGANGFRIDSSGPGSLIRCDSYNNGGAGIKFPNGSVQGVFIDSCNLVKNASYGINLASAGRNGLIVNCGFGSGTQANASGQTNGLSGIVVIGSVTYAADVTPWVDPANGDFDITLAAAKNAGRGTFTQTAASYTGTLGKPDIGASQSAASSTGGGAFTWS